MKMTTAFEVHSSSKNKLVLGLKKKLFLHLKYDTEYSKANALNLAILASAAYLDKGPTNEFLFRKNSPDDRIVAFTGAGNIESCFLAESRDDLGMIEEKTNLISEASTHTQCFHFMCDAYVLFAFRGTEGNLKDALSDANAALVPFTAGVGKVHKGFYTAFKSIQKELDNLVGIAKDRPVIICGHSLGGALGTLAAAYIRRKFKREVMLYTFGSPLVGDATFVHHFSKVEPFTYYRVIHNQDLVTMVPPPHANLRIKLLALSVVNPAWLIPATIDPFGKPFTHLGKTVFIQRLPENRFSVDVDRKTPVYLRVPPGVSVKENRPWWDNIVNWASISLDDHLMKNYISILASDLKHSIGIYLKTGSGPDQSALGLIALLEAEIKALQARRTQAEKDSMRFTLAPADATGNTGSRSDKLTPEEDLDLILEALRGKEVELSLRKTSLAASKSPAYANGLVKNIIGLPMTPAIKREFEYHAKNIRY